MIKQVRVGLLAVITLSIIFFMCMHISLETATTVKAKIRRYIKHNSTDSQHITRSVQTPAVYTNLESNTSTTNQQISPTTPVINETEQIIATKKVRILCWIMTSPLTLRTKCRAVKLTWGQHCDKILYFSSTNNSNFPTIGLNVQEGRDHLVAKTMQAFTYIYKNHMDDADWFLKADDDTFVIMDNLRHFLSTKDTNSPVYYGQWFRLEWEIKGGYNSGGAGYVLSKEALRRYGTRKSPNDKCLDDGGIEDLRLGECLATLGVTPGSTLDAHGRSRFHGLDLISYLVKGVPEWYYSYDRFGGRMKMSHYPISFHYVEPNDMFQLHFVTQWIRLVQISSPE